MRAAPPTRLVLAVAVVAAAAALAGVPVRATYGAQVSGDEPQYLLSALSLAEDGNLDIADELAGARWRPFHEPELPRQTTPLEDGREVSPHGPLLPLLLALPVAAAGWVGAKVALALLAGALAGLLVWVAVLRLAVPPRIAAVTVALAAASPPLAVYGSQVYPEVPAALAVCAALSALLGPLDRRGRLLLAAAVVALPWLAVKHVPVAAVLAALALVRLARRDEGRAALVLAAGLVLAGVVFLGLQRAVWGGWTPYAAGDHFAATGEFSAVGTAPDYLGRSRRLLGLLVDRGFGLAAWQPGWLLLVPALAALARRRPPGWVVLVAPLAVGWLVATFVALTMHGWWWPGRQLVAVLPAALLALAWWAGTLGSRVRAGFALLAGLGVWSYGWLLAQGWQRRLVWVVDFASTADPWYRAWRTALPDYQTVTARTWALHGLWLVVLAGLAVLAWTRAAGGGQDLDGYASCDAPRPLRGPRRAS